jgi:hypothetical protein
MTDETPLDLYRLDPGRPPGSRQGRHEEVPCAGRDLRARQLPSTEQAIIEGGGLNCSTPTYRVGPVDVTLLQITPLAGGWAVHVLLDAGDQPVTVERTTRDFSTPRSMFIAPVGTGTGPPGGQTFFPYVRAGWTTAEMYVAVPAGIGDRFDMRLSGTRGERLGTFTVDLQELGITVARASDSVRATSDC